MIGIGLTLASLAASAFGAAQSAKANREIDRQIRQRRTELQEWFNKEMGANYLDSTSGKSAIKLLLDNMRRENEGLQNSAAITGASSESVTGQKEKFMENYSNAIAKMLGYDTERKDATRGNYMGMKAGIDDLQMQNQMGKSQNWSNFMGNAANLGGAAILGQSMGAFGDGGGGSNFLQNLFGGGLKSQALGLKNNWINRGMGDIARSGSAGINRNFLSQLLPMPY